MLSSRAAFGSIVWGCALLARSPHALGVDLPHENAVPGGVKIQSTLANKPIVVLNDAKKIAGLLG